MQRVGAQPVQRSGAIRLANSPAFYEDPDIGKLATELADLLESESLRGLDAVSLDDLRRLAKQCVNKEGWFSCGPLLMKFTNKNQIKMPRPAVALTLALTYGFRKIPACVKSNKPFKPLWLDRLTGGQPCLPTAVDFANAALKAKNKQTNVEAVKRWIKYNRGRFRYGHGFGSL